MDQTRQGQGARRARWVGLGLALLAGCAGEAERRGQAEWERSWSGFQVEPRQESSGAAPLTSASELRDWLRLARSQNRGLQARAQEWRAALERPAQMRRIPEPRVSWGIMGEHIQTRVGPQTGRLVVSQMLPWPGKLLYAGAVAVEEAGAQGERFQAAERDLALQVTRAWGELAVLAQDIVITREILGLVQGWEAVAQARLRAGQPAAHRDAIKAQVEIGRLEDRLASVQDARGPIVERLVALLALPPGSALPDPERLPDLRLALSEEELLARLEQTSPLLRELDRRVAARGRGLDLAWQSFLPDLALGFEYAQIGQAVNPATPGSGDDAWMVMVGVDIPLWFGRYGAGVSEARARLRAAELDREDQGAGLSAQVRRALFAYRDAGRKVALYGDSLLPKARQALEAMAGAFEGGESDFLGLLDAERQLLELQLALVRARVERVVALAELSRLSGQDLLGEETR